MKGIRKFLLFCFCLLLIDITLFIVMPCPLLTDWQQNPLINQQPRAAAVLFHDFSPNNDGVSPETRRRLNHAVQLYHQGKIERIIVAGGFRGDQTLSGAQLMAKYLLNQNIPSKNIFKDTQSSDSISNIKQIRVLAKQINQATITLISSPYHLQRLSKILAPETLQQLSMSAYNPCQRDTRANRFEIFSSAHYNLTAYLLWRLLPDAVFEQLVKLIRNPN